MIAFEVMLVAPAKEAGIKVPENLEKYNRSEYPHWLVYKAMQLGKPMPSPGCHWTNAEVIAAISDEEITSVTPEDIMARGFEVGFAAP